MLSKIESIYTDRFDDGRMTLTWIDIDVHHRNSAKSASSPQNTQMSLGKSAIMLMQDLLLQDRKSVV